MRNICRHILRVAFAGVAFVAFSAHSGMAQSNPAVTVSPQAQQLIEFMRERKHAYEQSDAATWGKHVADQFLFIQAGGRVLGKAQFITEMAPFVGYKFSAVTGDVQAAEFGDTIVLTYHENEIRDYGTQRTENPYIDTETYVRLKGEWKLIAVTENALPVDPPVFKLDPQIYDKYVGTYEVNSKATFTVTREGNKLMGQYAGDEKFELLPASRSNFFVRGDEAVYAFVWDKSGHVVEHIYRAEGAEIRYKRK